jgi:hypothetical protein
MSNVFRGEIHCNIELQAARGLNKACRLNLNHRTLWRSFRYVIKDLSRSADVRNETKRDDEGDEQISVSVGKDVRSLSIPSSSE